MTLFKRDSKGLIRVWYYVIEDGETGRYRTVSGLLDGKQIISEWTQAVAQNVGKVNETTPHQQAVKECEAMEKKKIKQGYFTRFDDVDSGTLIKPMLANKYEDYEINFPVYTQPKLDGVRCLATKNGLFSRRGEKLISCPHIEEALKPIFDAHPTLILDGELYNHAFKENFNGLQSLIVRKKPTAEDFNQTKAFIQYHIYDAIENINFINRHVKLTNLIPQKLPLVHVETQIVDTQDLLDHIYSKYLSVGYEGQMIRNNVPYENKRTKHLLKRKEFQDAEFQIVAVEEGLGNRSGMAGAVICRLPDGREFGAGIMGGVEVNKRIWNTKREDFIGKLATIRFQNYTPDGLPRFPIFYSVRENV